MCTSLPQHSRPPAAERARTVVACARSALLTTYPRSCPARPVTTSVPVTPRGDGRLVVRLDECSLAARHLAARPLATVLVASADRDVVTLHGAAVRLGGRDPDGCVRFQVDVAAVRLGARFPQPVPAADYLAASPDPLRQDAPAVLEHLRRNHAVDLAACLRAQGFQAHWADARALDRWGLDLLAVSPSGVELVRLAFPRPVTRWEELSPGLGAALLCRCVPLPP